MRTLSLIALATALAAGCGDSGGDAPKKASAPLPQGAENVKLDPADFTTKIDNRWWPMRPGSRWVYRETAPDGTRQRVVVTVTDRTRRLANGVEARVVRDVASEHGVPVEVTSDYYAQDRDGNIWYLGEATTEYKNGRPDSEAGSFEAGKDGAQAGVIMPADPKAGQAYRQEYLKGEAEDQGSIVSTGEQAEVPAGHYQPVVMTRDTNPLEPKNLEFKFFARGVGPVLAVGVSGTADREELVSYRVGNR